MSSLDTLFSVSMIGILDHPAVVDEIGDGLFYRNGKQSQMPKHVEFAEDIEDGGPLLIPTLNKSRLSCEDLY